MTSPFDRPAPVPTSTPESADEIAARLRTLIDDRLEAGDAVRTIGWYRRLMDAATELMADRRGVEADDWLYDHSRDTLRARLADWPAGLWDDPHALGWLHEQYAAIGRRESFSDHVHREDKHDSSTVTTQLYTPRWVADVLAREAIDRADGPNPAVIDPAAGAGQMLLAALTLFAERAPEADPVDWIRPLWGLDLDDRVVDLARRTLALELARRTGRRHPRAEAVLEDQIGIGDALEDFADRHWAVALTNPPYMGWRSMPDELRERLDPDYRPYHRDLYSTFIDRCHQLATDSVGILAQQSIWYLRRFEKARRDLHSRADLSLFVHLGAGAFWNLDGEKASVVAFVQTTADGAPDSTRLLDLRSTDGPDDQRTAYRRLATSNTEPGTETGTETGSFKHFELETIAAIPGRPMCHDLRPGLRELFETNPPLNSVAEVPSQHKTGRNSEYVRRWDEVDPDQLRRVEAIGGRGRDDGRWVFYSKGGGFAPWWGNWEFVVDWSDRARRFYDENRNSSLLDPDYWFREGIVYTDFGGDRFNARWMPPNCLFDMTGPAVFPTDDWWPDLEHSRRIGAALAVLNSSVARRILRALNPTLHFQIREVRSLPIPQLAPQRAAAVAADVWELVEGLRDLHRNVEGDPLYQPDDPGRPLEEPPEERLGRLRALEADIDRRVCEAYGVERRPVERASIEEHHAL